MGRQSQGSGGYFRRLLIQSRLAAGLTQEELAERSHVSARTLSNLEGGYVARPRRATVLRLADGLGLTGRAAERFLAAARGHRSEELPPMPGQLPPDLADFTGRGGEVERALAVLTRASSPDHRSLVVALEGGGGMGKTSLALHLAHRLRDRYPDGQLYVNLAGSRDEPVPVAEALAGFLIALGVRPDALPEDDQQRAALYRSTVADKRVLVVLDDGRDGAQVRPLLPGGPRCAALVTSRRRLTDLEGSEHLPIGELAEDEAVELLRRVAGPERVAAEPAASRGLVTACGRLPLAVRIAASRLAVRPSWTVASLLRRLEEPENTLDELSIGDLAVRASFRMSYRRLPADQARLFALLSLWPGQHVPVPVAAALAGESLPRVELALEQLVDAHLVETPVSGRYQLHDLLLAYARELAGGRYAAERAAAVGRVLDLVTGSAYRASRVLRPAARPALAESDVDVARAPSFGSYQEAMAWYEAEWSGLVALLRDVLDGTGGVPPLRAARLATVLAVYPSARGDWAAGARIAGMALDAARRAGDARLAAHAHHQLGIALAQRGERAQAAFHQERALAGFRDTGDRQREATILNSIGKRLAYQEGRYPEALRSLRESLRVARAIGDRGAELLALNNLGGVEVLAGNHARARPYMEQALELCRQAGDRRLEAVALSNLGSAVLELGEPSRAVAHQRRALEILRSLGDRRFEAMVLTELSGAYRRSGQPAAARRRVEQALAIRRQTGDRAGEAESTLELGRVLVDLGDVEEARRHWRDAERALAELSPPQAELARDLLRRHGD